MSLKPGSQCTPNRMMDAGVAPHDAAGRTIHTTPMSDNWLV